VLGKKIRTILGGCIIEGNLKIRDKGVSKLLRETNLLWEEVS